MAKLYEKADFPCKKRVLTSSSTRSYLVTPAETGLVHIFLNGR